MAKVKTGSDQFSAIVYQTITESAANTLTFTQIQTGYGTLDRMGWVINRIEYYLNPAEINKLAATDDQISLALTKSNQLSALTLADAGLIDLFNVQNYQQTAVGFNLNFQPFIRDFTMLPGGGKLVLPYPLFLGIKGTSLATALTASMRVYFTTVQLDDSLWVELVEQTRLLS